MSWSCSADHLYGFQSPVHRPCGAPVQSVLRRTQRYGISHNPFCGDKSSVGILLSAKRRRDVAATNSAAVLSELTGLLPLKENKKHNFFSLEKMFRVFPLVALARFH